jgi:hypothetical protein
MLAPPQLCGCGYVTYPTAITTVPLALNQESRTVLHH